MSASENVATVRRNYEALAQGDPAPLLASVAPTFRYTAHTRNRWHGTHTLDGPLVAFAETGEVTSGSGAVLSESDPMQLTCVTVDCADPRLIVDFWAAALGCPVVSCDRDGAYLRHPGGLGLEFIRVDEPKSVKNRVHLGTRADEIDPEVERLVGLGATVAWEEDFPEGWPYRNVVLRDPEGNEFCLGDEPAH